MKKSGFKKISTPILIGLVLLLLFIPMVQVQAAIDLPPPSHEFYIYDGANIISEGTAQYIIEANRALYRQTGAQIVVATIPSLEGEAIQEYGNVLFRHWGIGSAQENNGVLLLIALEERQVWIEVGYGLEGAIPDGKAGEILDQFIVPYFQQGQYDQGILDGFRAILNEVEEEYQVEISPQRPPQYDGQPSAQDGELGPIQKIIIVVAILAFLFIDFTFFRGMITFSLLRGASRGGFRGGGGGRNRGGGGSSGGGGAGRGW